MTIEKLFSELWADYGRLNPMTHRVRSLLEAEGEKVLNDHVAFRTFAHPSIDIDKMKRIFVESGYKEKGEYHFKVKKLYAIHLEPPQTDWPKVFISQLLMDQLTASSQKIISKLIVQVPEGFAERSDFLYSGRPWQVSYGDYQNLLNESEYAAWLAAFGFRANHFTVNVNALKTLNSIEKVNAFLKSKGYSLNASGGEIKGGPDVFLEQSSTLADRSKVNFLDGVFEIPSVYYEFALRYRMTNGQFYQGFVERSADKIFESTDAH
jgi:hypothetical protein